MTSTLRIGTRGSALALTQTRMVAAALREAHVGLQVAEVVISTTGDELQHVPISEIAGRGVFVAEIERALLDGRIDVAVHSAKDLPSTLPPGLTIGAFTRREDPRDVLVAAGGVRLAALPSGARVGTSSQRRIAQLRALRPDLQFLEMRGNVDTRLRKLEAGQYDAIVLAAAGLIRLGRADAITEWLPESTVLPMVGQGALAVQVRATDARRLALVAALADRTTTTAVLAERGFLARLGAGCTAAVGAHAVVTGDKLRIDGMIGKPDGTVVRATLEGEAEDAVRLGTALADGILAQAGMEQLR